LFRVLLLSASGWLLTLACGSRTGLPPGRVLAAAGSEGFAGAPAEPECNSAAECPQPPPGRCGTATCTDGSCALELGPICDDGDPCTVDSCTPNGCMFVDGRVDADGDGAFASGTTADPKAALGCGKDCDDTSPDIFPGAIELCDALDNDCNGVVDDGAQLKLASAAPTRVSPLDADHSGPAGLAFDGESFGASMTTYIGPKMANAGRSQGRFQQLTAQGQLVGGPQLIARVNADSYGGALAWSGERYLTAYQDARQAGNYEVYFDLLNRKGERLIKDLRVTTAPDYSMRPSVVWTGAEGLIVWEDRRFEDSGGTSAIFGQRLSIEGQLIGANVQLSPAGTHAENASVAVSDSGVGIAFVTLEPNDNTSINFMTASRSLEAPSALTNIPFENADGPAVTALDGEYVVTFHQFNGKSYGPSIFGAVIKNGVMGVPQSMTTGAAHAQGNSTVSYGDRFVMVWADTKDGGYQLYAQTFDKKLAPISARIRLTTTMTDTLGAALASSADGGLGVLYTDENNGKPQTFFTRLDCTAAFQLK
jgi:Putative metal-binding motif